MPAGVEIRNSAGKLGSGLDIRGTGGYVLAPGSQLAERGYTWGDSSTIADPPAWLLDLVVVDQSPQPAATATEMTTIPAGRRNSTLASFAGSMRKRRMSPEAIEAALVVENTEHCVPPLLHVEVRAIARSVSRYVRIPVHREHPFRFNVNTDSGDGEHRFRSS